MSSEPGEGKDKWPQYPVVQGPECVRDGDGHGDPQPVGPVHQQQEDVGSVCPTEYRQQVGEIDCLMREDLWRMLVIAVLFP